MINPIERNRSTPMNTGGPFSGKQYKLPTMDYYVKGLLEAHTYLYFTEMIRRGLLLAFRYEPIRLWTKYEKGIKTYNIDWSMVWPNGTWNFSECKGWFDPRSRTTTDRYFKSYPDQARDTIWIVQSDLSIKYLRKLFSGSSDLLTIWDAREMRLDDIGKSFEWYTTGTAAPYELNATKPAEQNEPCPF